MTSTANLQTIQERLDEHFRSSDAPVTLDTDKGEIVVETIGSGWFRATLGEFKSSAIEPFDAVTNVIEKAREKQLEANRSVWCEAAGFVK